VVTLITVLSSVLGTGLLFTVSRLVMIMRDEEHGFRRAEISDESRPKRHWLVLEWDPDVKQLDRYLTKCRTCRAPIRWCNHYLGVTSNWHTIRGQRHSHPDGTPHFPD
jgi:hypothetical protein